MHVNPYAPPSDELARAPVPRGGEPQPWDVGEVLREAWELYKPSWAPLTLALFLATMIGMLPGQAAPALVQAGILDEGSGGCWGVVGALSFVGWVVQVFFELGLTRQALGAVQTGTARFGDVFSGGARVLPYFALAFVKAVGVTLGLVVLVVPGVILGLGLWMSRFYFVDQGLGPIAALRASWDASEGQKGNLLLLWLAGVALTFAGIATCCVGVFVTQPVFLLASAIVYRRVSGTGAPPASPEWGAPPGYGLYGPPGGYGPPVAPG